MVFELVRGLSAGGRALGCENTYVDSFQRVVLNTIDGHGHLVSLFLVKCW